MAQFFDAIDDKHAAMIAAQPVFFVATAAADGRINLSPKGYDVFRVLGPNRVGWLDLAGSGNETHAHLMADGRVTVMFCNFQQPAQILRLYGTAVPVLPADEEWNALLAQFVLLPGTRQIFDMAVDCVQTSCGYGVPFMTLEGERHTLTKLHAAAQPDEWVAKAASRTQSIDGLPVRPTDRYLAGDSEALAGTIGD
ncbi:pyridoxamine 5'-phosphate oxidase family protein [Croceicoccus ponticola]|uniref:Pyridoxamine 5'-phosphate oxidase family protein n=1 Tax=Croceicoccus ponticola TaxID=2217664 RepID=A0A437GW33_9SPHN|nr:pyridoxamine 5'-phosphate oxidase family protein [Croceicoccus ponticola]RVQ65941.1 pyridoxamine 5'-phosphate oxidase family protein [Croceicoccus ponticola]